MAGQRPIRFGVSGGTLDVSWQELRDLWHLLDELGFSDGWAPDHFYAYRGELDQPVLEAWTVLAAMAASTKRLKLGALVLGNTYRHPAILANMAATLDRISDGRLELGIGAGWMQAEHEGYGIPLPSARERIDRLEEAVQVLRLLFTQSRANFDGRYYQLHDAICEPKPIQKPYPPFLIGGRGERRTARIAAKYADIWHGDQPVNVSRKIRIVREHCQAVGRDPAEIEFSVSLRPESEFERSYRANLSSGDAETMAERQRLVDAGVPASEMDDRLRQAVFEGFVPADDAQAIDQLNRLASYGITHFILLHRNPYRRTYLENFMTRIAPRVRT
jgi:F420-dependent oxidoreductase-like protein